MDMRSRILNIWNGTDFFDNVDANGIADCREIHIERSSCSPTIQSQSETLIDDGIVAKSLRPLIQALVAVERLAEVQWEA